MYLFRIQLLILMLASPSYVFSQEIAINVDVSTEIRSKRVDLVLEINKKKDEDIPDFAMFFPFNKKK